MKHLSGNKWAIMNNLLLSFKNGAKIYSYNSLSTSLVSLETSVHHTAVEKHGQRVAYRINGLGGYLLIYDQR